MLVSPVHAHLAAARAGRDPQGCGTRGFEDYLEAVWGTMRRLDLDQVERLAVALRDAWGEGRQVFICGNGGSAANAIHIANDLVFGVADRCGQGIRVQALSANQAVMTCLANDVSYEAVFSRQLEMLGRAGDLLIVLSGSGNSRNVLGAIRAAKRAGMPTWAIVGYSGGHCLTLADHAIHLRIDDMQIAEDFQLIIGHMVTQWLKANPPEL
jgi:D-sedoheptulose 7-phosphate isomerase